MTVIVMFDRTEGIRLTHSPSGGGFNTERQTTNPAWDFQFVIAEVRREQGLRLQGATGLPAEVFARRGAEGIRGVEEIKGERSDRRSAARLLT